MKLTAMGTRPPARTEHWKPPLPKLPSEYSLGTGLLPTGSLSPSQPAPATRVSPKRKLYAHELHFDPEETGVFPPRPPELHSADDYIDTDGDLLPPEAHPFGWVPVSSDTQKVAVRPQTGHIQTKSSTTLPLEYFDSPDMELVPPEERLAAKDPEQQGVLGFSRFFTAQGTFTWAPCWVLAYDRCG